MTGTTGVAPAGDRPGWCSRPSAFVRRTDRTVRRDWEKARRVPSELRAELARASSIAENAWVEAKRNSDFEALLPHLRRGQFGEPVLDDPEARIRLTQFGAELGGLRNADPAVVDGEDRFRALDLGGDLLDGC